LRALAWVVALAAIVAAWRHLAPLASGVLKPLVLLLHPASLAALVVLLLAARAWRTARRGEAGRERPPR
jgi:hypothetical protein